MTELHDYSLRIDAPLLRQQRRLLDRLRDDLHPHSDDRAIMEGVINMLDEVADQAHDRYGIDCLIDTE